MKINAYKFARCGDGVNGSAWTRDGFGTIEANSMGLVTSGSDLAALHHAIYKNDSGIELKFYRGLYGHSEFFVTDIKRLVQ